MFLWGKGKINLKFRLFSTISLLRARQNDNDIGALVVNTPSLDISANGAGDAVSTETRILTLVAQEAKKWIR